MHSPDILDIVPEHVADPVRRAPWRARLLTGCGDGLLALLLNGAVMGWLIGAGWPLRPMAVPQAISVDLVDHMPEPKGPGTENANRGSEASNKPEAGAASGAAAPNRDHDAQPSPEAPPAQTPEPQPQPKPVTEPQPQPEQQAQPEAPHPSTAPAVPADASQPSQAAQPADATPSPQPAAPPPPEHPDDTPAPRLVEAPSAPPPALTQTNTEAQPEAAPPAEAPAVAPTEPPAQPPVLATPEGADAVPPPAPPPEVPKPPTAEQRRQAENTAKLAALLPFGANIRNDPLQAMSGDRGQGASTAYRGQVYANFNKQSDVINEAKAKHLKGQAVVAFTLDDQGGLAHLAIVVSSGNPDVDRAALELIRRGAPYPPPPPGAQRSFSPAIGLGLDD